MENRPDVADDVWFAHGIHVDEGGESEKSGREGGRHVALSQLEYALGFLHRPGQAIHGCRVKVGLGVDGSSSNDSSNILQEVRQAMLLARLRMGLLPPEGPRKYSLLSQSHPCEPLNG